MEKSIKINIAGMIFQISEEGYELLKNYLQSITNRLKSTPGGNEMIEDIEARIAEIFQHSPDWKTAVISQDEVKEMIGVMGSPEEIAGEAGSEAYQGERQGRPQKLYRDTKNNVIGGVCSGIAEYIGIDVVWIRILFALFTLVYLVGLFVYLVLWIALPSAPYKRTYGYSKPVSEPVPTTQAKTSEPEKEKPVEYVQPVNEEYHQEEYHQTERSSSNVGNAFNEILKAFGKFFVILFRIILALIGVSFIITGFSAIMSYIIITFFHSSVFMSNVFDTSIFYLPDFLSFIVNPSLKIWLIILTSMVVILPLTGMIYWGIRMVFQFRARDLVLNLVMLIIWILSCTALALVLFSEGISFSNSGRISERIDIPSADTIYIEMDRNKSFLDYDREVKLPFDNLALYLDESERVIYGTPEVDIYQTDEDAYIEVLKYSKGKSRNDAMGKADRLEYGFKLKENTFYLDEYFAIPPRNRWSGAYMKVKIYLPEDAVIYIDEDVEDIMDDYLGNGVYSWETGGKYWEMTEDGLEETK